jgi:hypothetical protein
VNGRAGKVWKGNGWVTRNMMNKRIGGMDRHDIERCITKNGMKNDAEMRDKN